MARLERVAKNEMEEDLPDEVHLVSRTTYSSECFQILDRWIITKQYHIIREGIWSHCSVLSSSLWTKTH